MEYEPSLNQINLAVRDMDTTVAFYRRLGLPIEAQEGAQHVSVTLSNGITIEWDLTDHISQWDSSWAGGTGGTTVFCFSVPTRDAVDEIYAELTAAGYHGRQQAYDAFWGARYAIVEDPDGNFVGLMSPVDLEREYWPPDTPSSENES